MVKRSLSQDLRVAFLETLSVLGTTFSQEGGALLVRIDVPRRKEKALAGTWNAHLNNMVKGVTDGFTYTLKALYSHFPMTLAVKGNQLIVTNLSLIHI